MSTFSPSQQHARQPTPPLSALPASIVIAKRTALMMTGAPVLYQETRLSPTPASPASILHINAGGNANSSALVPFGAGRKRPFAEISHVDEDSYARKHLATEGSVYFRPKDRKPRSFLWRVLNDRQLLELQCVDLILDPRNPHPESSLTFHIALPAPIIPNGVALADAGDTALEIFVLTTDNDLFTITLGRHLLARATTPTDFDSASCVKRYASNSFTYKHPYRLVAASNLELFVSLHDGSIVRLQRDTDNPSQQWQETHFSEGGWTGSLKRSFPFAKPQTVRHGKIDLYSDAVTAIAKSPDGKYVWTVGLDHKLKAWSTETGRVDAVTDLLEDELEDEERKKHNRYVMGAEQGTLLQVVIPPASPSAAGKKLAQKPKDWYILAVHSPKDHQFKFYRIKHQTTSVEGDIVNFGDVSSQARLIPPIDDLMDTNMWHLEHFAVNPGPKMKDSQLWIRARSGASCKTFLLTFDLDDDGSGGSNLSKHFENGWTVVDSSSLSTEKLKDSIEFHSLDPNAETEATSSEKWLDFLFYPGRFSEESLEAALHIYRKGRNLPNVSGKELSVSRQPLKARIIGAISSKIMLRRLPNEQPDYQRYRADLHTQWITLFSVLSHLHNRRHESIGFAFDHVEGLPWTVCADFISPIRASSPFELMKVNADLLMSGDISTVANAVQDRIFTSEEQFTASRILFVARLLRHYFSAASQAKFKAIAVLNAFDQSGETSIEESLQALYSRCRFQDEIRDRDYDALTDAAEEFNGLGSLSEDNFIMILEAVEEQELTQLRGRDRGEKLARRGDHLSIAIVQETLQDTQSVLLDLLALVVFIYCDLEQDELSRELRPVQVTEAIMLRLRQTELRLWLTSHVRQEPDTDDNHPRTLYESMFRQDWTAKGHELSSFGLPELLTTWSKQWAFGLTLTNNWDKITAHILADLLKHQDFELGMGFIQFLREDPWISYLRGRLYLAVGDYALASAAFRDAASGSSRLKPQDNALLTPEEFNYFGAGEGQYYQHVAGLFDKMKVFSYTADFASLALRYLKSSHEIQQALHKVDELKKQRASPAKLRDGVVEDVLNEAALMRERKAVEDLSSRLFNALVQTGRFENAFSVLVNGKDPALQRSNLHTLLQTCVKQDAVGTLLELPIKGDLAQEADTVLLALAKKSMDSGLPSGPPYHQILFSFRTQHSNFRGAAAILYEHLEHLQKRNKAAIQDPEDETLVQIYVLLINTLACCPEDEGWLLADPIPGLHDGQKRKLVTLEDIRRDYQAELDRRSDILQGRFPLVGGDDEMDMF